MDVEQSVQRALTLVDILSARARETPRRTAFTFIGNRGDNDVADYSHLWERVCLLAGRVREASAPGDRIVLLCPPGPEFVYAFLACLSTGRIAVPAPLPISVYQASAVTRIVRDSGASAAIAPLTTPSIGRDLLGTDIRIIDSDPAGRVTDFGTLLESAPAPDDIAFLQYTSGSTGTPKGVTVLHRNLMHNLGLIGVEFEMTQDSSLVSWLPPYHDMGLIQGILLPLFWGIPATLMAPLTFLRDPLVWLRAISENQHVIAGGPNLAYGLSANRVSRADAAGVDLSGWSVAFVGAEPVDPNVLRRFADTFAVSGFRQENFLPAYGLAESTLYVSGGPCGTGARSRYFHPADLERGIVAENSAGRELLSMGPVESELVAVVDRETLRRCGDNRIGEIWLRGKSITAGYWNKPEDSARTFRAKIAGEAAEYLRTGDLGFVLDGELYISGRIKELIIVHGRNIFPQDIERTITAAHPMLRPGGCAAFSAHIDNEDRVLVVQELDGPLAEDDADELASSIRDIVSRVHTISLYRIIFVGKGEVPKTTSGKIRRQHLRETYSSAPVLECRS